MPARRSSRKRSRRSKRSRRGGSIWGSIRNGTAAISQRAQALKKKLSRKSQNYYDQVRSKDLMNRAFKGPSFTPRSRERGYDSHPIGLAAMYDGSQYMDEQGNHSYGHYGGTKRGRTSQKRKPRRLAAEGRQRLPCSGNLLRVTCIAECAS